MKTFERHASSTRMRILRSLRDDGPGSSAMLAERLQLKPDTIEASVRRLVERGDVFEARTLKIPVGKRSATCWAITADGVTVVDEVIA